MATATFVLCIERNAIREQALMLCASIREFGGRHANSPIIAYSPRAGMGVDADTRAALRDMNVEYVDAPLNTECTAYGSTNRVVAGAHAEQHADTDFLVVLDSDTVWLGEPELPVDQDAALRPADAKGSATGGPGDPFEPYWQAMAALRGLSLDCLPWLQTTVDNARIRASYNGGLIVVRRDVGILRRCADLFLASVRAQLRPRPGLPEIRASTGLVGREASEYWGSNQTALALATWSLTQRVLVYPDRYNVPLHSAADSGSIAARWLAQPPVHVHYHWMFDPHHAATAMRLLERMHVPARALDWLGSRLPLRAAAPAA